VLTLIFDLIRKKSELLVGIDVGGTKTHLAVEREGVHQHVVVATDEWQRGQGLFGPGAAGRLLDLVRDATGGRDDVPLAVGAHGCDSPALVARFDNDVRSGWAGPVLVVNDAELLAPAAGVDRAICLIVGTGSIVIGRMADGEVVYVGGHGWLLDDYGSAPGIVREAVRAALDAVDDGRAHDGLAERMMAHFGATDEVELSVAFTGSADIATWAAPARHVFAAADEGSATAVDVIDDAARRLAANVLRARRRGAVGDVVVAAGGVISNQPRLFDAVARHLVGAGSELELRLLEHAPVMGAVELARRLDERDLPEPRRTLVNDNRGGTA
jgi:N-acetylglucosamine kinase-like BadF-type ATPase